MCDNITKYINDNNNIKSFVDIYNDLIKDYSDGDIKFIFNLEYNINIEETLKIEYELREKRFYQQKLRKEALIFYNNKCIISDIKRKKCLEVAHIKPVSHCESLKEKSDVENTFVLWIDLHKYFDNFDFSINPNTCKIEIKQNCEDYDFLKEYENKKLNLTEKNKLYLQWHYDAYKKIQY